MLERQGPMVYPLHDHRRSFPLLLSVCLMLCIFLLTRELTHLPDGHLHLAVLDVGQGDASLLVSPSGKKILIDGGPNLSTLEHLGRLLPFFDRTIDLLVLTHPEADHLTAFPDILQRYTVRALLLTGVAHAGGRYEAILTLAKQGELPLLLAHAGQTLDLHDGTTLTILWPPKSLPSVSSGGVNQTSIVLRVAYGTGSILFAADIDRTIEEAILASGVPLTSTVLRVPHHGSDGSSSPPFLIAVRPALALISVARENPYRHPHPATLRRYATLGIPVRTTAEEGTIDLTF